MTITAPFSVPVEEANAWKVSMTATKTVWARNDGRREYRLDNAALQKRLKSIVSCPTMWEISYQRGWTTWRFIGPAEAEKQVPTTYLAVRHTPDARTKNETRFRVVMTTDSIGPILTIETLP